jgi:hypothetical protein
MKKPRRLYTFDHESSTELAQDELANPDPFPEIHSREAEHFYLVPDLVERANEDGGPKPDRLPLNENAHILVLGGAQGITPVLVSRLTELHPCHYILVDRFETHSSLFADGASPSLSWMRADG